MKLTLKGLDGLRGISILIVLLSHVKSKSIPEIGVPSILNIFFDGNLGVHVFFVLSGFLISYLLLIEKNSESLISIKYFYLRRILRILPAFLFLNLTYAFLQKAGVIQLSTESWISSLLFLKWMFGGDWITGHFWSLSIEENFYLFFPFIFKYNSINRLKFILFSIILFSFVFRIAGYFSPFNCSLFTNSLSIFYHFDSIAIGAIGAIYFEDFKRLFLKYKLDNYFPIYIFIIGFISSDFLTNLNYKYDLNLGILLIPFGVGSSSSIIVSLNILLIVYSLILTKSKFLNGFFNSRLLIFIGKLSFSIYLWQQMFFSTDLGLLNSFPLNLLLIAIVSISSYFLIEKPFLKLKMKFST